jgi:2-iminobutanoate/2-iminopropanoate deaminase
MDRTTFFLHEPVERRLGFARAVRIDRLLFISGTVSIDPQGQVVGAGDMAVQLEMVYSNLARVLASFDASLATVVKETIYATDIEAFLRASSIRARRYADIDPPATTGVEVRRLAHPDLLVEIEAIAALSA